MQYQLQRLETSTHIEFNNSSPLKDIKRLKYYREGSNYGEFPSKDFRISLDNINWEPFLELTQANISSITLAPGSDFYIQVRYEKPSSGFYDITSLFVFFEIYEQQILPGNMDYQPVDVSESAYLKYDFPGYLLDRLHHTGPFSDLEIKPNEDPSVFDLYSHREDSSIGTSFVFKGLVAGDGVTITEDSSSLKIDASGTGGNTGGSYTNPEPVVKTVGGIETGDTFFDNGKTFEETMASMFYPTLYPTFSDPFNTLSLDIDNLAIIDDIVNINFTATFNRGTISPAYGTTGNRSGLPNTYHYTDPDGSTLNTNSIALTNVFPVVNYLIKRGIQAWQSRVSFDQGEQPLDSIGEDFNSPYPSGHTNNITRSIEGVYPLFGTTSSINTYTQQPLISMLNGNNIEFNMVPESDNHKQAFSIANDWLISRPLLGVETYNEFSGNWEYTGGSPGNSLALWTQASEIRNIVSVPVNYTNFIFNGSDRSSIRIRLTF
jgi:hypothetical protein